MNRCQFCSAPSTIHLTDVQEGLVRSMHLCERCGREHDLIPEAGEPQINVQPLLHLLMVQMLKDEPAGRESASLTCPDCGLNYHQFRKAGRLGCPSDYDRFSGVLAPLLERIHRAAEHVGKHPRRLEALARKRDLRARLSAAVAAEDYKAAAALRDALKDLANE